MKKIILTVIAASFAITSFCQIYQWRGENRDGHFSETKLLKEWPENGPELLLEIEGIGKGYSSPIATENTIFITGMIDTLDYLTAYDFEGNQKWQVSYGDSWKKSFPDTRCSPTVEGDRVYVLSGTGRLACINTETGKENWAVMVDEDFEAEWHRWGVSESILIVDNMVICTPGGEKTSVVAFDKMTGKLLWQSESLGGPRSYASPTVYQYNDFRFILAVTGRHLIALDPETGKIAWSFNYYTVGDWSSQTGLIWPNTPLFKDDEIFITKGYDYPAVMVKMDSTGTSATAKFTDQTLDNHHGGVVLVDDQIYGSNWKDNRRGRWVSMNWDKGEITYVKEWETKGSIVYADGLLYVHDERRGTVGLVEPDADEFKLISSFKMNKGAGPHWAHPYILDGRLYIRHGDVFCVYDVAQK